MFTWFEFSCGVQNSDNNVAISKPSQIKIYGKDGELIHE